MPERWLRQGIRTSEAISSLSDAAFRLYVLLITHHDDFGRFDARPELLRSELYPLRVDRVRVTDLSRLLAECQKAGVVALYGPESKPIGLVLKTDPPRNQFSRFPPPPEGVECWRETGAKPPNNAVFCAQLQTVVNNRAQLPSNTETETKTIT